MKDTMKKIYAIAIWLLAVLLCVVIWPVGKVKIQEIEQTGVEYNHFTEPLSNGVYAVQPFIARENYLQDIVVMVDKSHMTSDAGNLQLQLMDESGVVLQTSVIPISEVTSYANIPFTINMKIHKGNSYSYSLQALDTQGDGPLGVYRVKSRAGTDNLGNLSYFGTAELPDAVSMVKLRYGKCLAWYQIIVYDAFFLLLAALLTGKKTLSIVFRK